MNVEVIKESAAALSEYEKVPIAFRVESRFLVVPLNNNLDEVQLIEEPVEPYLKDYDAFEDERPTSWAKRFDISQWAIFSAFVSNRRVGGATVVWDTPEVKMLEERIDLACLWDLRIHPDYRSQGVGHQLFTHAVEWARLRNCRQLKIETQNINVPACRFYARQGCKLRGINRGVYGEHLDEIQLLWYLDL